jgi:hypothetical protein
LIDLFTKIGATVGLVTGIFTLLDRLFRARPIAYVHVRGTKGNPYRYVRIANVDKADMQVIDFKCWPRVFAAAKDHSLHSILTAAVGRAPLAVIAPGENWDFPLVIKGSANLSKLAKWRPLVLAIFWRRSSSPWLPQFPKAVIISVRDLQRLEENPRSLFGVEK